MHASLERLPRWPQYAAMAARAEAMVDGWHQHEERNVVADLLHLGAELTMLAMFGDRPSAHAEQMLEILTALPVLAGATAPHTSAERFDLARRRATFERLERVVGQAIARWATVSPRPDCILGDLMDSELLDEHALVHEVCVILLSNVAAPIAAAWTLHDLHVHSSSRDRLEIELDHAFEGRRPGANELAQLPYLGRVIKESMRLHPPFALIAPWVERPWVHVSPHQLHRDPAIWPRPRGFEPDRWDPDSSSHRVAALSYYMPFGYGSRRSISDQLSVLQIQIILATVAARVHLDLRAGHRLVHDQAPPGSMIPLGGSMPMRVGPRSSLRVGPRHRR